jgi:nicotinate phosphoribosyltransferase
MSICNITNALLTDLYELTMMQGYFFINPNQRAVFEMFFRRQPFGGGFAIFAGLDPLIDAITNLKFEQDDIQYLQSLGIFKKEFLHYLSHFKFNGDIYAVSEGTAVFPNEPLIRVEGSLIETQLIESLLLNIINFQTLIATKTARIVIAANGGSVIEFGFRRAHGVDGAISGTRAAYIGGAIATSNVLASKLYNIPARGTMAHSWVMSFDNELKAFEKYAELYKDNCILLVDTYDTLKSGVPNAVKVFKKLKKEGRSGYGIRLDSGDLEYLSREARKILDKNDLKEATIIASNELDEWIINQIMKNGAPINGWGVGSKLITADKDPWLTGVYKLVAKTDRDKIEPVIKISNNPEKITNPGIKNIFRFYDRNGMMIGDLIYLEEEENDLLSLINTKQPIRFNHPSIEHAFFTCLKYYKYKKLLQPVIKQGKRIKKAEPLDKIREHTLKEIKSLDPTYKRLINPHIYKVSISDKLKQLKISMLNSYL